MDDRYNPENLLVTAITPGPKEFSCDELQHLLEAITDDKIRLYNEGIVIPTPKYPDGKYYFLYHTQMTYLFVLLNAALSTLNGKLFRVTCVHLVTHSYHIVDCVTLFGLIGDSDLLTIAEGNNKCAYIWNGF